MITALTLTDVDEAVGITRASQQKWIVCNISFTVNRGGMMKTGQLLREATLEVDERTSNGPAYYMINCAHPDNFGPGLEDAE